MNELEKAANEYASCDIAEGGLTGLCGMDASKYEPFIAGAQWQAKQSPWISVEERLPEHDNGQSLFNVIIKFDDGSYYIVANIDVEDMAKAGGATHWCAIPE